MSAAAAEPADDPAELASEDPAEDPTDLAANLGADLGADVGPDVGADRSHRRARPPAPASVRLVPLIEPGTGPLQAQGPLLAPPPEAGSALASGRDDPEARAGRAVRVAGVARRGTRAGRLAVDPAEDPLPDPTPLCCAMVQAAVEALRGARPLAQLARWVSPEIYAELEMRSELTQRVTGRESTQRAAIRRIRLCRLGDRAAEASIVVDDGQRVRAVAVRLEGHRGQWRATAMVIG